jgi:lipopolysaccharide transport system permease protein
MFLHWWTHNPVAVLEEKVLVIEAGRAVRHYWSDLWPYRELFVFLASRDILVRYKQTVIGVAWVLLRPALTMLIFTLIFGKLAKLPSGGVPYSIFVFAGLWPWLFFSSSVSDAGGSLISSAHLLTKVYFPRVIVPASVVLVNLIDFLVAGLLLIILMFFYGVYADWRICVLPLLIVLLGITAVGMGLLLSAVSVKYRDFSYITPFLIQLGLYISPVGYSSSIVPEQWRIVFYLNPMAGIIDGFRWALFQGEIELYLYGLALSIVLAVLLFVTGLWFFRKTERTLADDL